MSGNLGISFDDEIKMTGVTAPSASITSHTPLFGPRDMQIASLTAVPSGPYVDVQRFRAP